MAGNQLGKTLAGGVEAAMHVTGRYPDWWQGKRFDEPTSCLGGRRHRREHARQSAARAARPARLPMAPA